MSTGTQKFKVIGIALLVQALVIYLVMYFTLGYYSSCRDILERPHEKHKLRIRPHIHSFPFRELEANDKRKLINITNFQFIHVNENICSNLNVFLLVLIPSAPGNKDKRHSIRVTWGDKDEDIKVVFMLGLVEDPSLRRQIDKESKLYGDIVQGNFIDAYTNMSYKAVMSLKYAVYYCPQATYILKIDDDSFVNMPLLKNFLKHDLSPYGAENLFLCNVMSGSPAIREKGSKWYISEDEFPDEYYPDYCSGWYAIFSPDVAFKLYKEAQKLKYLYIDDAFVYGIAAKEANLTRTDISYYTLAYRNPELLFNGTYDKLPIMFGWPNMNHKVIKRVYDYYENKPVPQSLHKRIGEA